MSGLRSQFSDTDCSGHMHKLMAHTRSPAHKDTSNVKSYCLQLTMPNISTKFLSAGTAAKTYEARTVKARNEAIYC
jgi:hypothetical protein